MSADRLTGASHAAPRPLPAVPTPGAGPPRGEQPSPRPEGERVSASRAASRNVAEIVEHVEGLQRQGRPTVLQFSVDNQSRDVTVRVFNAATGEMIREIPTSEMTSLAERLKGYKGLLVEYLV